MIDFSIDTRNYVIRLNGQIAKFSKMRFDILQTLYEARGVPRDMDYLVAKIYGQQEPLNAEGTLRVAVSSINMISRAMTSESLIGNVNRQGYFLLSRLTALPWLVEPRWALDGVMGPGMWSGL